MMGLGGGKRGGGGGNKRGRGSNRKDVVQAVAFGRNFFYPRGSDDDNNNNKKKNAAAEEEEGNANPVASGPWKDNMPKMVDCTAQATIVLTKEKGKVYQMGTMHGYVCSNWTKVEIPLPLKCDEIATGRHFVIAKLEYGKAVVTWGAGHFGQLGVVVPVENNNGRSGGVTTTLTFTREPVLVERLLPQYTGSPISKIAAGDWHGLALTESGQIWSWGCNRNYQCGHKSTSSNSQHGKNNSTTISLPLPIPSLLPMQQIAAGRSHSCSLTQHSGQVYCWGSSHHGQCGTGYTTRRSTASGSSGIMPSLVQSLPPDLEMIQIAAGGHHTLALSHAGRVFAWGDGREGQLGLTSSSSASSSSSKTHYGGNITNNRLSPTSSIQQTYIMQTSKPRLIADLDFVAVAASSNNNTQQKQQSSSPEYLAQLPRIASIHAAASYSTAVSTSGHVYCWGSNDVGQLGGLIKPKSTPLNYLDEQQTQLLDRRQPHVRTFDSDHNVLLPTRCPKLDHMFVQQVALGPNHMWCFGKVRNDEDNDKNATNNNGDGTTWIVGKTLFEVEQDRRQQQQQQQQREQTMNDTSIHHHWTIHEHDSGGGGGGGDGGNGGLLANGGSSTNRPDPPTNNNHEALICRDRIISSNENTTALEETTSYSYEENSLDLSSSSRGAAAAAGGKPASTGRAGLMKRLSSRFRQSRRRGSSKSSHGSSTHTR